MLKKQPFLENPTHFIFCNNVYHNYYHMVIGPSEIQSRVQSAE